MPTPLSNGQNVAQKVPYQPYPCGEGKSMRFFADFLATDEYQLTLNNAQEQNQIDIVQSIYVDNFGNLQPVVFIFAGANQRIIVPAGAQGYFPVLATTPVDITITSAGSANSCVFHLLNFPTPCFYWPQ